MGERGRIKQQGKKLKIIPEYITNTKDKENIWYAQNVAVE
jgi:hypothetical protein